MSLSRLAFRGQNMQDPLGALAVCLSGSLNCVCPLVLSLSPLLVLHLHTSAYLLWLGRPNNIPSAAFLLNGEFSTCFAMRLGWVISSSWKIWCLASLVKDGSGTFAGYLLNDTGVFSCLVIISFKSHMYWIYSYIKIIINMLYCVLCSHVQSQEAWLQHKTAEGLVSPLQGVNTCGDKLSLILIFNHI